MKHFLNNINSHLKSWRLFGIIALSIVSITCFADLKTDIENAPANSTIKIADGTYYVSNINPPNGLTIECESLNTIIRGTTSASDIFVTSGSKFRIKIKGGTWEYCRNVWRHTGNSALSTCLFENMFIKYVDKAFYLETSVGNIWRFVEFYYVDNGINFASVGQCNVNSIINCKFLGYSERAVEFSGSSPKCQNVILNCWFEAEDDAEGAIFFGSNTRVASVRGCYFEECGDADNADIILDAPSSTSSKLIKIEENIFGPANASQSCRIQNNGISSIIANDNDVTLLSGVVFAEISGANVQVCKLENNYLNAVGGGDYKDRLFDVIVGTQKVSFSVFVGSGFVTNDECERTEYIGAVIAKPVLLGSTATPSIQDGNTFTVGSGTDITDFSNANPGQKITLIATAGRKLVNSTAIKLTNSTDFTMTANDSITLIYIDNGTTEDWVEVSRSDK
jgi:hypothetical protein